MAKKDSIFNAGDIVFLTNYGLKDQPEIVLEVEDISDKILYSSKVLSIQKEVKGNGSVSLIPLGNAFIFSSLQMTGDKVTSSRIGFNLDNFSIFGKVTNPDVLKIFNDSFLEEKKKSRKAKSVNTTGGLID